MRQRDGSTIVFALCVCVLLHTLRNGFNDRLVECGNIVRFAAEDELTVGDDSLVNPVTSCVFDVRLQRRPRRDRPSLQRVCFHQRPRSVTNGRNRFSSRRQTGERNSPPPDPCADDRDSSRRRAAPARRNRCGFASASTWSTFTDWPQSFLFQPLISPLFGAITTVVAPALFRAFRGSINSACSNPSVAKMAIVLALQF